MRAIVMLAVLLVAPLAQAGDSTAPELTDPAGDWFNYNPQNSGCSFSGHTYHNELEDYDPIDVTKAWITGDLEDGMVSVFLQTVGDIADDGDYIVDVKAYLTDSTLPGSVATIDGQNIRLRHNGGSYSGPEGGSSVVDGNTLMVTAPKSSMGLTGGEDLGVNLVTRRAAADYVPLLCIDGSGGRDDSASSALFSLPRIPMVANITAALENATLDGAPVSDLNFVAGGDRMEFFAVLNLTNGGTDMDNITANVTAPEGIEVGLNFSHVWLLPGESHLVNVTLNFTSGDVGPNAAIFNVTSSNGGAQVFAVTFDILPDATEELGSEDGEELLDGNETLAGGADDDQEAPGVALPLLAVGLLAVALRRRD